MRKCWGREYKPTITTSVIHIFKRIWGLVWIFYPLHEFEGLSEFAWIDSKMNKDVVVFVTLLARWLNGWSVNSTVVWLLFVLIYNNGGPCS